MRVLTWHVHGSYLYYLAHAPVEFYLPVKPGRPEGYGGCSGHFAWPANVHEIPAEEVRDHAFDLVLTQSRQNYLDDRHELLSPAQRRLPAVHLEHDPPRESVTDERHFVDDPNVLLVHVTHFNALMWDSGCTPSRVIEHGVAVPEGLRASYELDRGIAVVNGMPWRGRRLGADVFEQMRAVVPLDLAGMQSEAYDGLGDLPRDQLLSLETRYRFFFNPIRYTSLGLAVIEAMAMGLPIVGLATTELATVIEHGRSGSVHTDLARLREHMLRLCADPAEAARLGEGARECALERFSIERFVEDWTGTFEQVANRTPPKGVSAFAERT